MKDTTHKPKEFSSASVAHEGANTRADRQRPTRLESMAKILGCTVGQINTQLAKNARTLRTMHSQAVMTGKKVNGFTASDLDALAESYEQRVVKDIP